MIRKRKKEVRNISAGELVRFHSEMKLAVDGEKRAEDWILSRALKGKNSPRNTKRITTAEKTGKAFFSFWKAGDLMIRTRSKTSVAPNAMKNTRRMSSFWEEILARRDGELSVTVATISFFWFRKGKKIV